jgi:hypothetical protein
MTTTVTIKTVEGDKQIDWNIVVNDVAQKHVLRSFNVTSDAKVDASKVLCAALIQQMIDLRDAPGASGPTKRAASIAITDLEKVQMAVVKANFVQA